MLSGTTNIAILRVSITNAYHQHIETTLNSSSKILVKDVTAGICLFG